MTDLAAARRGAAAPTSRARGWMRHPLRRKNLRPRVLVPTAFGLLLLSFAEPTSTTLLAGLPLIAAGAALRTWATGHLIKTDELVVTGPYARLRHPLYAGTLLIALGFCALTGWKVGGVAALAFLGFFFGYYFPRKERIESRRLEAIYGDRYRAYHAEVRPLLPSLRPWRGARADARWRLERVRENDELGTLATVMLALAAVGLAGLL